MLFSRTGAGLCMRAVTYSEKLIIDDDFNLVEWVIL